MLEYAAVLLLILAIVLMTMTSNPVIHLVSALFILAVAMLAMYRTYQMVQETRSAVAYVDSETAALSKATNKVFNAQWAVNNGMSSSNAASIKVLNSNSLLINKNMSSMSNSMALSHSNLTSGLIRMGSITSNLQTSLTANQTLMQNQMLAYSNLVRSNILSIGSNINTTNSNLKLLSYSSENAFKATHANLNELTRWTSNNLRVTNSNLTSSLTKLSTDTKAATSALTTSLNKLSSRTDASLKGVANTSHANLVGFANWTNNNLIQHKKMMTGIQTFNQNALKTLQANVTTMKNDFNVFGSASGGFGILKSDYTSFANPRTPLVKDSAKLSTLNIQDVTISRIPGATSSGGALKVCLGNSCGILMTSNIS